ncbi:Hypothetical predicted protein [Olea europaea subsp. europaea]|uniref:Uncharacterized protein n=1 Tax=Olea europaea subsp. europaea TaxID=158383 RepID=A0A8S0VA36_OLEEU|nr:Hypothetical predicted protein [Olea europaea subsp. europaea]
MRTHGWQIGRPKPNYLGSAYTRPKPCVRIAWAGEGLNPSPTHQVPQTFPPSPTHEHTSISPQIGASHPPNFFIPSLGHYTLVTLEYLVHQHHPLKHPHLPRTRRVQLLPAEQAIRPAAPINILSTQNSWRKVNQYKQGRQDNQDEADHEDDVDIHPDPQHEPLADTPVLRQKFATMTQLSRDVQQLQTQEDVSDLCRSTNTLIGRLDRYTGMMDGMQFWADQTYDMVRNMQIEMG